MHHVSIANISQGSLWLTQSSFCRSLHRSLLALAHIGFSTEITFFFFSECAQSQYKSQFTAATDTAWKLGSHHVAPRPEPFPASYPAPPPPLVHPSPPPPPPPPVMAARPEPMAQQEESSTSKRRKKSRWDV